MKCLSLVALASLVVLGCAVSQDESEGGSVVEEEAALATGERLRYSFDAVASPVTQVADDSGNGHTARAQTANGGAVRRVTGHTGRGIAFPSVCVGSGCPRAVVTTPNAADLNPGSAPFFFGARVRLTRSDLTRDHGSNVVQKGLYDTPQWKLQIDDATNGRPSCVLRSTNGSNARIALSTVGVADGSWHNVVCRRTSTALTVLVDGVARGSVSVSSTYSIVPGNQAVNIGAKGTGQGNDQYHGQLDDVFFGLL